MNGAEGLLLEVQSVLTPSIAQLFPHCAVSIVGELFELPVVFWLTGFDRYLDMVLASQTNPSRKAKLRVTRCLGFQAGELFLFV